MPRRFENPEPSPTKILWDVVKWRARSRPPQWPDWIPSEPAPAPPERSAPGAILFNAINHATVLMQVDGANLLADPIWSARIGPLSFAGPRRVRAPGLALDQLPPIDAVLLSHNHFDHMDLRSLTPICERHRPVILCGLENARFLRKLNAKQTLEMDWWESRRVGGANIHFVPAQHWSRRGLRDTNLSLWGGFVIESSQGPVYFAGDSAYGAFFGGLRRRFGPMRLSFLPIGSHEPRWFMKPHHMSPEDAAQAHLDLESRRSIGIHYGTFEGLADDDFNAPVEGLAQAREKFGIQPDAFQAAEYGRQFVCHTQRHE
ncbi:MAG TPA: MBL fold metallo-hydrolase [Candidatus Brocadiia bacterium]|nr:MBL fold metallo-hydrolase [Candidatus Brocadiia bacterium]